MDDKKGRFKKLMNGLKLNKPITLEQTKAIEWAILNDNSLLSCIYVKKPKIDKEKFELFKKKWPSASQGKIAEAQFAKINIKKFDEIMKGLDEQIRIRSECARHKVFCPQWKGCAKWLKDESWLDDLTTYLPTPKSSEGGRREVCQKTQEILKQKDHARKNAVTDMSKFIDPKFFKKGG